MNLATIFTLIALVGYLGATIVMLTRLFTLQGPNINKVLALATGAIISHLVANGLVIFTNSNINFSLPNVVSLVSLLLAIGIYFSALRYKVNLLLPVIFGFAALWQLIMLLLGDTGLSPIAHPENIIVIGHIALSLLAYCILVIATLFAFQVFYINLKLKSKNLTVVKHLPPLMQAEKQLFTILIVGTACLVLSLLSVLLFLENFINSQYAHQAVLSLLAAILYIFVILGRFKQGWRGSKVLILMLIATTLLTLGYFGSRFVREFIIL